MVWSGARRARLPSNWRQIREQVRQRDGYQCVVITDDGTRCTGEADEVDHIEAMTDDHRLEALQSMCTWHHRRKSAGEGGRAAHRFSNKRPRERHPGLM